MCRQICVSITAIALAVGAPQAHAGDAIASSAIELSAPAEEVASAERQSAGHAVHARPIELVLATS
jgi:hypothetical protein